MLRTINEAIKARFPCKGRIVITALLAVMLSQTAWGWGAKGHVLISQIAFDRLTPSAKQKVNQYAQYILEKLPVYTEQQLADSYKGAIPFAKLTVLPDSWRGISLADLFRHFNAPLPIILKPYRHNPTDHWHFEDYPYPNTHCRFYSNKNLEWAVTVLQKAWQQSSNAHSRAIILILLVHLVEDAHQPLHTLSLVNKHCKNDRGGNDYPILVGRNKKTNLHKIWDLGIGYLNHPFNYQARALRLQQEFPESVFRNNMKDLDPQQWSRENYRYAKFIYSVKRNHRITPHYYQHSQTIVRAQITLAGYRLANWLNQLLIDILSAINGGDSRDS